jgi:hypothetical protein
MAILIHLWYQVYLHLQPEKIRVLEESPDNPIESRRG